MPGTNYKIIIKYERNFVLLAPGLAVMIANAKKETPVKVTDLSKDVRKEMNDYSAKNYTGYKIEKAGLSCFLYSSEIKQKCILCLYH